MYVCSNFKCANVTDKPNTKINQETTAAGMSFPTTTLVCPSCGEQMFKKTSNEKAVN